MVKLNKRQRIPKGQSIRDNPENWKHRQQQQQKQTNKQTNKQKQNNTKQKTNKKQKPKNKTKDSILIHSVQVILL